MVGPFDPVGSLDMIGPFEPVGSFDIVGSLRAVSCKNRLRVWKIEESDFLKICQNKGFC